MKRFKIIICVFACLALMFNEAMAGNTDRSGEAGAYQLLMNPWARSSGLHGLNSASTRGVESMRVNVAGLAYVDQTQIVLARSIWFQGSETSVTAVGFGQKMGESGVLGVSMMSTGLGDINVTTTSNPEGTGATYSPSLFNLGLAYSREFSNSIRGGATIRLINESISDVSATGVCIDAGIMYTAGDNDEVRFGISLRNVGTPMTMSGDGLSFTGQAIEGDHTLTQTSLAAKYELPTMLNIGGAYDFLIGEKNRLTLMGNFISNSFTKDVLGAGLEFSLLDRFMLRGAYRFEANVFDDFDEQGRTNVHTGLSGGFSVELPLGEEGPAFGIDYSYRATNPFGGTHTLGLILDL